MEMNNLKLEDAANKVIHERIKKIGGDGGLIAINNLGEISMPFNTEGMYRAAINSLGKFEIGIY